MEYNREPKQHELKIYPVYFNEIINSRKRFEVRINDRDFRIKDTLMLREYSTIYGYSGNWCIVLIESVHNIPNYFRLVGMDIKLINKGDDYLTRS